MSKKSMALLMVMALCFLFYGYPLSTTAYGAQDKVTESFEDNLLFPLLEYPNANNLPDVVVTYKDGACTVKNIPAYKRSLHGLTDYPYHYSGLGNAGVFVVMSGYERGEDIPEYFIIDTNKTPVTAKRINVSPHQLQILNNGVAAFLEVPSITLVKPDGTGMVKLDPLVPDGYKFTSFGVDYCAQSGQYAVMYGVYPESVDGFADGYFATKRAGVALFDEKYKLIKQFLLKDLYCEPSPPLGMGSEFSDGIGFYSYCKFSVNTSILYAGGMVPKSLALKKDTGWEWDWWVMKGSEDDATDWIGKYSAYDYYKINLDDESYEGISKLPESKVEIPFKVQYNKMGTYIYTKSGDEYKTLASLKGDYIAASYSVNLDGSVQVIFVSDAKTRAGTHPLSKRKPGD